MSAVSPSITRSIRPSVRAGGVNMAKDPTSSAGYAPPNRANSNTAATAAPVAAPTIRPAVENAGSGRIVATDGTNGTGADPARQVVDGQSHDDRHDHRQRDTGKRDRRQQRRGLLLQ